MSIACSLFFSVVGLFYWPTNKSIAKFFGTLPKSSKKEDEQSNETNKGDDHHGLAQGR